MIKISDKRSIKGEATKSKIIKAGIELFSKKGFDGTSVSEISLKAKLTKSLVYHHFKNKEEILMTIIDGYQLTLKDKLDELTSNSNIEHLDEFFLSFKNYTQKYLSENRKLIKIILIEAFKDKTFTFYLFKTFDDFMNYFLNKAEKISKDFMTCLKVEDFYFHFMPMITFSAFHELWCEYYKEDYEKVKSDFFNIFSGITHSHSIKK